MAIAQLTFRESLRDIEVSLGAQSSELYHLVIRSAVAGIILSSMSARARRISDCRWGQVGCTRFKWLILTSLLAALRICARGVIGARPNLQESINSSASGGIYQRPVTS